MASSSSSLLSLSLSGLTVACASSPACHDLLGFSAASLHHRNLTQLLHPDDVAPLVQAWFATKPAALHRRLLTSRRRRPAPLLDDDDDYYYHEGSGAEDAREGDEEAADNEEEVMVRVVTAKGNYRVFGLVSWTPTTLNPQTPPLTPRGSSSPSASPPASTPTATAAATTNNNNTTTTTTTTPAFSFSTSTSSAAGTTLVLRDLAWRFTPQQVAIRTGFSVTELVPEDEVGCFAVLLDRDWTLRHVSPAFCRQVGYAPLEPVGLPLAALCPGSQVESWRAMANEFFSSKQQQPDISFLGALVAKDLTTWELTLSLRWIFWTDLNRQPQMFLRGTLKLGSQLQEDPYHHGDLHSEMDPGLMGQPSWDLPFSNNELNHHHGNSLNQHQHHTHMNLIKPEPFCLEDLPDRMYPVIDLSSFILPDISCSYSPSVFGGTGLQELQMPFTPVSSACPSPTDLSDKKSPLSLTLTYQSPIFLSSIPLSPLDLHEELATSYAHHDARHHPYALKQHQRAGSSSSPSPPGTPSASGISSNSTFSHKPQKRKCRKSEPVAALRTCTSCGTNTTPEWRKGPAGPKTLCNACGLYYAKASKLQQQAESAEQVAA